MDYLYDFQSLSLVYNVIVKNSVVKAANQYHNHSFTYVANDYYGLHIMITNS